MRQISLAPITGKYSNPSGPTSMALGDGRFSSRTRGAPPAEVELHQPAAVAALVDEQPVLVDGDAVGAGRSSRSTRVRPPVLAHADPAVHHLGGVQIAARVESDVVGRDDVAALRADGLHLAGGEVECADLAAGHLRDVDAAVGAGAQTVGAEQPARRGEPLQPPAGRDVRQRCRGVAALEANFVQRQVGGHFSPSGSFLGPSGPLRLPAPAVGP